MSAEPLTREEREALDNASSRRCEEYGCAECRTKRRYEATVQAAEAEVERLRAAATELLRLKDGPRDAAYRAAKQPAWDALRDALEPLAEVDR